MQLRHAAFYSPTVHGGVGLAVAGVNPSQLVRLLFAHRASLVVEVSTGGGPRPVPFSRRSWELMSAIDDSRPWAGNLLRRAWLRCRWRERMALRADAGYFAADLAAAHRAGISHAMSPTSAGSDLTPLEF